MSIMNFNIAVCLAQMEGGVSRGLYCGQPAPRYGIPWPMAGSICLAAILPSVQMVGFCGIQGVLLWPATTKNPMSHGWQCMPGCDLSSVTDGGCLGYLGDFIVAIQPLDRIHHGSQCMPGCDLPTALDGGFLG